MAFKSREPANGSMSDALLFTTMCIVGSPVDVQVKDGSVYSGIFHTACVENGYGIVLKMARMARKGKSDTNLVRGALIDTLVILSGDLVQVIAKGILLPANGLIGNLAGENAEAVAGFVGARSCHIESESEPKSLKSEEVASERITLEDSSQNCKNGSLDQNEGNEAAVGSKKINMHVDDVTLTKVEKGFEWRMVTAKSSESVQQVKKDKADNLHLGQVEDISAVPILTDNEGQAENSYNQNSEVSTSESTSSDFLTLNVPTCSSSSVDVTSNISTSSKNLVCNVSSKEFKLNPCAKTFSPSSTNPRSAALAVAGIGYVPNSSSLVPVAGSQPGVEINSFLPHVSPPVKFVQSNSLVAGSAGSGSQYSQPIVGHLGGRPQPVRYGGQVHPVQAGPAYLHPNAQTVMVGRLGQVVYVHPFSHDAIQGGAMLSHGSARPLFAPHQASLPKHQGTTAHPLQLCMAPPFIAGAQQPFAIPNHISISQPFPVIRPLPVPNVNSVLCSKFPL